MAAARAAAAARLARRLVAHACACRAAAASAVRAFHLQFQSAGVPGTEGKATFMASPPPPPPPCKALILLEYVCDTKYRLGERGASSDGKLFQLKLLLLMDMHTSV